MGRKVGGRGGMCECNRKIGRRRGGGGGRRVKEGGRGECNRKIHRRRKRRGRRGREGVGMDAGGGGVDAMGRMVGGGRGGKKLLPMKHPRFD